MEPMIDQVRQRTDELRRVAEGVRRERDLRAAMTAAAATIVAMTRFAPSTRIVDTDACTGECLSTTTGQAA